MTYLNWMIVVLHALTAVVASWHALLYKRDSRAAFGWIGVCILFPLVGPLLYYLLGVNRVENRARLLSGKKPHRRFVDFERGAEPSRLAELRIGPDNSSTGLARASLAITGQSLVAGNHVAALFNGENAYPPMLAAIDNASESICLMTYIFETNSTGRHFIGALGNAVARGVDVRVIIDGMGEKYSFPRAAHLLKRVGVAVSLYNPPRLLPPTLSINLRSHRKVLVIDNVIGFTGGMNIGDRHLVKEPVVKKPVADIHFALQGPVVAQLRSVFAASWHQATRQELPAFAISDKVFGNSSCRVIIDGPDENLDRLALVLQAAVTSAQHSIRIMTPYFLPSQALIGGLQSAALRGVNVELILPGLNNLPYVHWATRNMLWELLYYNINVFYQPPPFAHSKLFLVDDNYVLMGSANIDPRSLRLNFELGVEIYDPALSTELNQYVDAVISTARRVTLSEVDGRSLPERTRDAFCWLFSPYL